MSLRQVKKTATIIDAFQEQPLLGRPIYCLDDVVELLSKAKEEKQNIAVEMNGTYLYSMIDDAESCYQKVCGKSKSEFQMEMFDECENQ